MIADPVAEREVGMTDQGRANREWPDIDSLEGHS